MWNPNKYQSVSLVGLCLSDERKRLCESVFSSRDWLGPLGIASTDIQQTKVQEMAGELSIGFGEWNPVIVVYMPSFLQSPVFFYCLVDFSD